MVRAYFYLHWITGSLELIPAVKGQRAGYMLDRQLVYHRANADSQTAAQF